MECEYLPLAQRLAAGIQDAVDITPVLVEGHDGIFAVTVDGKEVFNNLKQGGHVPPDTRIIAMVRNELEAGRRPTGSREILHAVLNPMGYPPEIEPVSMAPRLDRMEGKTIWLVDARFDDSDRFLQQMQHWFEEHLPDTETVFVSKAGVYTEEDWDLWVKIKEKGDAMIMGVGH